MKNNKLTLKALKQEIVNIKIAKAKKFSINEKQINFKITKTRACKLEGKELLECIFNSVTSSEMFKSFGNKKIMILSAVLETKKEHNLHSNILVENDTTFEEYYNEISFDLDNYYNLEYGYNNEAIIRYIVKIWNCDHKDNSKIKMTHDATKAGRIFNQYKKDLGIYKLSKKLDWELYYKPNSKSFLKKNLSCLLHKGLIII